VSNQIYAQGVHAVVCKKASGTPAIYHVSKHMILQMFGLAGFSAVKEPLGLRRLDGKRPDRLTDSMARWKTVGLEYHCRQLSGRFTHLECGDWCGSDSRDGG